MTVQEGGRDKQWVLSSLLTLPMQGPKSPSAFVSALAGGFDNGERANYVSVMLRYPYGPYIREACANLGATVFSAADDDDRLRYIGNNYQLQRYPFELGASFETRCGLAWDLHGEGGTSVSVRKALEAYGFPEIYILEEHIEPDYFVLTSFDAGFQWAHTIVFGPNYGDLPIAGMYLGTWILGDDETAYLGLGSFSSARVDEVVRVILSQRQVHDMPWRIVFRFGDAPILGLMALPFVLGGSTGAGAAYRDIQASQGLGNWILGQENFLGFGV